MNANENGVALIYYVIIVATIILIIISLVMIGMSNSYKNTTPNNTKNNKTESIMDDEIAELEINSIDDFEFDFENSKKKVVVTIDDTSDKYDVDNFGGVSKIIVNGKAYTIEELLKNNVIDIETIIEKLEKDAEDEEKCYYDYFMDGGSRLYVYQNMTVIITASMSLERQSIMFGPSSSEINGIFDAYLTAKENNIEDIDFDEGMVISAKLAQKVNDELWIVKEDYYADTLIKITDDIEIDSNIEEGDMVNIVFSGKYEEGSAYSLYAESAYNEEQSISITIYNDKETAKSNGAHDIIEEVLGEKCWLVRDESSSIGTRMFVIDCDYELKGDKLQEGARFKVESEGIYGSFSWNHYLKDVTKIKKAR